LGILSIFDEILSQNLHDVASKVQIVRFETMPKNKPSNMTRAAPEKLL